jgi:predicted nucleotidyltransferase
MTKTEIIQTLTANKQKLHDEFGLKRIGLFGSYAKDLQTEESDIDFVFEMEEGAGMTYSKLFSMNEFFEKTFSKKIDLVNIKNMNPFIKKDAEPNFIYV